ncbi:hypothetical protein ETD86_29385 [Nonomuraea turkmeniaca]|uniref:Uncharacterized protein n=1 Tax=Nonomuraea turkmeniaca TaxID=103838 RepID=A0A5S4FAF9_9ACTN|nr:hypothetical protein [Nonomuraea turkmeniaca]TMR14142.1 hypothetical protein ETD86_29385 [Nonomuraea turkmeniaca]
MDIRNDPERLDERLDESGAMPPIRTVPVLTHDNDGDPAPAPTPDQLVFDQAAQPPPAPPVPPVSVLGSDPPMSRTGGTAFRRPSSTIPAMPCNAPTHFWTRSWPRSTSP